MQTVVLQLHLGSKTYPCVDIKIVYLLLEKSMPQKGVKELVYSFMLESIPD